MRYVLGISALYHDSAACLLRDGAIVAAAQEERFTRTKGDAAVPVHAVDACLRTAGISIGDVATLAYYDKPLLTFERLLETWLSTAPRGWRQFLSAGPVWLKEKLFTPDLICDRLGFDGEFITFEHHESHAASAYYPSPFTDAAILTIDGVGEWATSSIGVGSGAELELVTELRWPDSLGLLYSAFTQYLGFKVNSGEYKVMGLAPYGTPRHAAAILDDVVALRDDGSFRLNQRYFDYLGGLSMTSTHFHERFGGPPRAPESPLLQRHMDLARSIQDVCEEIMLRMARTAHARTGRRQLVMAGGVALNCVGNGRIHREGPFDALWIQPAAGDAGGAVGAALLAWHRHHRQPRSVSVRDGVARDAMQGAALGPSFGAAEIEAALAPVGAVMQRLDDDALVDRVARELADGRVVGWMCGRMEFGPRALGGRSILGDPRSPTMQKTMNLKIKHRESFRPFAPSVLREHVSQWFELDADSPYMLLVAPVKNERCVPMSDDDQKLFGIDKLNVPRSSIPAVTHVDYSARVQTVSADASPHYHALLSRFFALTGCPVLVNTSFNVRGEPIVCTPLDAYRCFMRTGIETLVVWPYVMRKEEQPPWHEEGSWQDSIPLD